MAVNNDIVFTDLYQKAERAGYAAVEGAKVQPMIVTQRANPFDDKSKVLYSEYVADGVCGFAWVKVKPANSAFAKWLVSRGYGRKDSYEGGVRISVSQFNQSMQKKEAYAYAFANVLSEAGITAYAGSRMD